ncbi:MAG: aminoacyl-tRNA hydrolase [Clostridiales bacterium]|jgi:PTH1 family peptidyl-tRNA hydrolase|nr:aminoacyl-tRNA hydrolase [Clostridiales bacterium]
MRLIIGLGNPEREYKGTRHNTGFEVINKLSYDARIPVNKSRMRSQTGEGFIGGEKVMFVKPQTYMNASGEAVRDLLRFYKLSADDIIVVYDDSSLPVGHIRVRKQGGAGGHNGVKNIIYHLETDAFRRVRVGIGTKPPGWILTDYVLSRFTREEEAAFIDGVTKAGEAVLEILERGIDAAMNKYNQSLNKNNNSDNGKRDI